MSITTLIAGGQAGEATSFVFDAMVEKEIKFENDITKHPVERGSDITDNVVNQNTALKVKGYITNSPIEGLLDSLAQNREVEDVGNRVQQAYDLLKELRNSKRPFTIITELDTFRNCVINSLYFPEESGSSNIDVLEVRMEVEEIRTVSSQGVFVTQIADEAQEDSQSTENEGAPSTEAFSSTRTLLSQGN